MLTLLLPTVAGHGVDDDGTTAVKVHIRGRGHTLEHHDLVGDFICDGFPFVREGKGVAPWSQRIVFGKKAVLRQLHGFAVDGQRKIRVGTPLKQHAGFVGGIGLFGRSRNFEGI